MATWHRYREKLEELVLRHPSIFPRYKKGSVNFDDFGLQRRNKPVLDEWGCLWNFLVDGLDGQVVKHPLEDWKAFESFRAPDPDARKDALYCSYPSNWEEIRRKIEKDRKEGLTTFGSVPHGFMFMRLHYLRGFTNLMLDFVSDHRLLQDLINMVLEYNLEMIRRWLEIGVDIIMLGDDLGMQERMPISPESYHKYVAPAYEEILKLSHEYGAYAYLHSDGHILEVAEDLIKSGLDVINPQVGCNSLEGIKDAFKGKICIDLDVDRQYILPFGSPQDVRDHIKQIVFELGSKEGGLWIIAGCYPDVPLDNIETLCRAMEDFQSYFSAIS